ncbi:MAG TPA: protein-L-isoaspartate(D-aspartate) O-methyltransferase [Alphaproteobacteria bacterium]|nr:protein-L-isoaspartate(D-aspartate) O-methyltransferase [Alphaproteobacteria bacterium]
MTADDARRIRLVMELRRCGITDTRVLSAIERIPREQFVPAPFLDQAYEDVALPIGHGQTLSQPSIVARMTQALGVGARMKVLEIGTGSGYQAAILARLCRRLYTIERHRALLAEAEQRFRALALRNITTNFGDGAFGWPAQAPFDRIILTAAANDIPDQLVRQLGIGGIMVLPVGDRHGEQRVLRVTRLEERIETDDLGPARFVPLVSTAATAREREDT